MLQFTTTAEAAAIHGVKCLAYSDAGMGKTMLCATAPAPVVFSAESGLLSLRKANIERVFGVNQPNVTYNLPVIIIRGTADLFDAYNWLTRSNEARQFATGCVDSLSEIAEVVLADAKRVAKDPRQAYGEMNDIMAGATRAFRDISGKNIYMTAKCELVKDDAGVTRFGPSMPGRQYAQDLAYYWDGVFKLAVGKMTDGQLFRYLQTQPDLQNQAKDRSGALAMYDKPDLSYIFDKMTKGV